jgi:Tol biopolymer transport system component
MINHPTLRTIGPARKQGTRLQLTLLSLLLAAAAGTQVLSATPRPTRQASKSSSFALTKRMVFVSEFKGNYDVYIMSEDGGDRRNLTNNPADDMNPRLSPDGTRIVFETRRDGNAEIYSMTPETAAM